MAKISIQDLYAHIQRAQAIVLTAHVSPDGDAIGSMIAFYEALLQLGKEVHMVVDDVVPKKFAFLGYADKILDIQAANRLDAPDALVVLDASTFERIGKVGALWSAPIFNIDHHISNTGFAEGLYLREDFSSTGEIVAYLCKQWDIHITRSMAEALYTAIVSDTGFFKFSNTTSHTLEMAALCVEKGARPHVIAEALEVMTKERLEITKRALSTIQVHGDGSVASIAFDEELMNLAGDDTDGYVDIVRNIEGVDVAIFLKAKGPHTTRVSLRSSLRDVNEVAQKFGGGGHIRAAGLTIEAPIKEALWMLLKELL